MSDQPELGNEIKLENQLKLADDFTPPSYEEWRASAEKALKGAPFEKKLVTKTYEGIDLKPIYTEDDINDLPHLTEKPGFGSRLRGNDAAGYLDGQWEIAQEIKAASPQELNKQLKYNLERGQTGITLTGESELNSLEDLAAALQGIDLTKYPLHIIAGFSAKEQLERLIAFLEKEGIDKRKVKGSIDADPLAWLAEQGSLPISFDAALDRMAEAVKRANRELPGIKTIAACGLPYHNAGADAVSELAYVLASAVLYAGGLLDRGLDIDTIAGSTRFTFAVGPFFFMETAKIRAARILWSRIIEAYGGGKRHDMTVHAKTSYYNQTLYDPYVNMLRTTTEAFSAIVAGVDSLCANPFNEITGGEDEFACRAARNTQVILEEECGMDRLIDPAGGSYFVETLTHQVAQAAWIRFQEIEANGGMFNALKKGLPQDANAETAKKRKADIAARKSLIVGANFSADVKEAAPPPPRTRKPVDAGTAAVTVKPLDTHRQAEIFEEPRRAVDRYREKTGAGPKLFLAAMGPLSQHKARADFAQAFFETGGFDVIYPPGFETPEAAVDAALESGAGVVVICSNDDTYPGLVPPITKALKDENILVILAGYPKDRVDDYIDAGVDEFIYIGADAHKLIRGILNWLGVLL
jgi:methylmalonyl-CoA mutase